MIDLTTLRLEAPAASFYDALLIGDGCLGAAVHGHVGTERVDLNLDTFWSGGPLGSSSPPARSGDVADQSAGQPARRWLAPLREAVRERDWRRADELAGHLQARGWAASYQPLGALLWRYAPPPDVGATTLAPAPGYERRLDMATAVATVGYGSPTARTTVTAFVSAVHSVLVLEATGPDLWPGDGPSDGPVVDLDCPHPGVTASTTRVAGHGAPATVTTWTGRAPVHVMPNYFGEVDDPVVYDPHGPGAEGLVDAGMGFAIAAVSQQTPRGHRLLVAAVDGFRGRAHRPSADLTDLRSRAVERVLTAAATGTSQMHEEHVRDHRQWFDRMSLELHDPTPTDEQLLHPDAPALPAAPSEPDRRAAVSSRRTARAAEVARFFHLGRYLLIASSRPGSQPANLQGIWNTDVRPGWGCNWTTNINLQMNYWPAGPAGLIDLADPLHRLVEDLASSSSSTASDFYDAAGWAVHHNTDLWGRSAPVEGREPVNPACTNWPAGGLWLAAHYATSRAFADEAAAGPVTDDLAADVVLGAAELALALLEPHPDGRLVTNPSTSPEHLFLDDDGAARAVSAGSAMDQQLVAEVLQAAVDLVDHLEQPPAARLDLRERAHAALRAVRPPQIGTAGDLLEWADERPVQDRGHRHVSHLYGLFPGHAVDERRTPELFAAARTALHDRIRHGGGGTGWSQAWILCLAARLRDPLLVQQSLDVLVHDLTSDALLDLHPVPDHPSGYRFQIDGNLGAVAGVLEALVYSARGEVRLLPALPPQWAAGSVSGLRAAAGAVIDLRWDDGRLRQAQLTSTSDGTITVYLPDDPDLRVQERTDRGAPAAVRPGLADGLAGYRAAVWDACRGDTLIVDRTGPDV